MAKVLIIDDDIEMCNMLAHLVTSVNHEAEYVTTLGEGVRRARKGKFDIVFLDVRLPDGSGIEVMLDILGVEFPPEVIIITGSGDSVDAEKAIKNGAWDYIQKPLSPKNIIQPLNHILQYRDGLRAVGRSALELDRGKILGNSSGIKKCLSTVSKAAQSKANVLITGETGTGKELFAHTIHANSSRRGNNFIVVDCAALPDNLVESVLFGHEKGSFTGADKTTRGLVGLADGGTLFLDEVGEMNLNVQKVFLRVLQERKFRPVGCKHELSSQFRVIAATNRNLQEMVAEGTFREDLLYRLNAISLQLPPLRERHDDIEELTNHLVERACNSFDCEPKSISKDFQSTMTQYDWPGNVRELVNAVEAAVSEAIYEPTLFPKHLADGIRIKAVSSVISPPTELEEGTEGRLEVVADVLPPFKEYRKEANRVTETNYLRRLMRQTRGNIKKACEISGLSRSRLYKLMKNNGIDRMGWS